jgi:Mrp family chromosome partitioning ATPase
MIDDYKKIIVRKSIHSHLDIIPVGVIPPNPTELLLDNRLNDLLTSLRDQYDYIFLDCTPAGIVSDASIVGKMADLTLFIIRAGLMDRRSLFEVEAIYQERKFKNMAVMLNATSSRGKYGYYRYGYHYGYGETKYIDQ